MRIRKASILDIRHLIKIEKDEEKAARTFSIYLKQPHMEIHMSANKKAYMLYEWLHPGSRCTAHLGGKLKGKMAKDFLDSSMSLYFKDHPPLDYMFFAFRRDNKVLRLLGSQIKNVSLVGEMKDTEDIMYIINRGER